MARPPRRRAILSRKQEIIAVPGPGISADSLKSIGIRTLLANPKDVPEGMCALHTSNDTNYTISCSDFSHDGKRYRILSNDDIQGMLRDAAAGLDFVIVDVEDWKIIPLENAIAKLHDVDTRIFVTVGSAQESRKMFSVLDIGVDGVILDSSSIDEISQAVSLMGTMNFDIQTAKVTAVREIGDGERVCVDTVSMLGLGEGMLVGNRSNFLFLVHNESVGSSFTSPRPFRVNAGAVHCYTVAPDGTTKYLSELESGFEVLVVNQNGKTRRTAVGRSKIERRPMLYVAAATDQESGSIMSQNAETIRFMRPGGDLVSVTHLKVGDQILVHSSPAAGRHFGMRVADEYIVEK